MNNWRPEGWEDIKDKYLALHSEKWAWDDESFEMGADTMLEALKERGTAITEDQWVQIWGKEGITGWKTGNGYLVFIPDKETD